MAGLLVREAGLADGRSAHLQVGMSLLVRDGRIAALGPDGEVDPQGAEALDGGGATIIPAMVDAHSHLTMPGGSHWIDRGSDPPHVLMHVARRNARRLVDAGVLWARDVGSPAAPDPLTGGRRALALQVRQELKGKVGQPYIRVGGTWIAKTGYLPLAIEVPDGEGLREAALRQLDDGADFVKIMMDAPAQGTQAPFSVDEVRKVCGAVHARGARITAHATILDGARVAAEAGVDAIEHGIQLDDSVARTMAANGVSLVSTLSIFGSWESFGRTTTIDRFTGEEGRARIARRRADGFGSIQAAKRAGVRIAAGSDFGGGSVRAGHLAWEVEFLVEAGLEPWEALAAVTWRGGEVLGIDHAGRLAAGAPADFVLVHGDPLSDPRALWRVWAVFQSGSRII